MQGDPRPAAQQPNGSHQRQQATHPLLGPATAPARGPGAQRMTSPAPNAGGPTTSPPVVLGTRPGDQPAPAAPIPPVAQPDVDPRNPRFRRFDLPVATTDHLPGMEIVGTVGLVMGVATRPRDLAHHPDMAYVNATARQDAVAAMVEQAVEAGADGVVGLAFDGEKISQNVSEVTAYGTAVTLRR